MNITKKNKKFSKNKSYSYKRKSLIVIGNDYSIETLYNLLITNPILVNQKDNKEGTFLSYAIQRNKNDIFDLILTSPILDLNYQDKQGNTYLHIAVKFERENMVKSLIDKGILINIQNKEGNTPLHLAYILNNKIIISYLIENPNIDLSIKNNNGDFPENLKQKDESDNNESSIIDNCSIDSDIVFYDDSIKKNNIEIHSDNRNILNELNDKKLFQKNKNSKIYISNKLIRKKNLNSFYLTNLDKKDNNIEQITTNISNLSITNVKKNPILNDSIVNKSITIIPSRNNNIKDYNNEKNNKDNKIYYNKNEIKKCNTINSLYNKLYLKKINLNSKISIKPNINMNNDYYHIPSLYQELLNKKKLQVNKMNLIDSNNKKYSFKNKNINQSSSLSSVIFENINTSVSEKSSSNDLILFLQSIQMENYYLNLYLNGFDDIKLIINQTKTNLGITNKNLKDAGINFIGDRAKIIIKIQELAGNFSYKIPKEVYYKCENLENIENDKNIKKLNKWLKEINLDTLLSNFITNGYHSIELLLFQLHCKEPLTMNNLKDDLGIKLIGFRQRIYNKLNEDWNKSFNKLKHNLVIVNEETNTICNNCNIF